MRSRRTRQHVKALAGVPQSKDATHRKGWTRLLTRHALPATSDSLTVVKFESDHYTQGEGAFPHPNIGRPACETRACVGAPAPSIVSNSLTGIAPCCSLSHALKTLSACAFVMVTPRTASSFRKSRIVTEPVPSSASHSRNVFIAKSAREDRNESTCESARGIQ
eukprot:5998690-Pleurochrysis_carterae.AAC.2